MVERFVEAVLRGRRARSARSSRSPSPRRRPASCASACGARFTELGEHEHARAAEGAWVGTIHGFCARVLRAHPLAAGLDPRFAVLDEPAAQRLREAAWDGPWRRGPRAEGEPAVDLLAASATTCALMVGPPRGAALARAARAAAAVPPRAGRRRTRPRCGARWRGARRSWRPATAASGPGGRDALAACRGDAGRRRGCRGPGALGARRRARARGEAPDEPACEAYREA